MRGSRAEYDLAYCLFLFSGLASVVMSAISAIPMSSGTAGGVGFFVAIPLVLASLLTSLCGIALTLKLRDQWGLILLSMASALFVAEVFTEVAPTRLHNALPVLYGAGTLTICALWFFRLRSRHGSSNGSADAKPPHFSDSPQT